MYGVDVMGLSCATIFQIVLRVRWLVVDMLAMIFVIKVHLSTAIIGRSS